VAILASGPISEHRPCNRLANVPIAGAVASLGVRVQRHPTASLQGTFVGDVPSSAVSLRHRRAIRCGRPNQACASSAIPRPFQKVAGVVFELSVSIWRGVACSGQRRPPRTARPVVAPAAAPRPGSQPRACISRITESMRSAVAFAILCPSRSCRRVILQIRGFTNDIRDARGSPSPRPPRRTGDAPRPRAGYPHTPTRRAYYRHRSASLTLSALFPAPAKFAASARAQRPVSRLPFPLPFARFRCLPRSRRFPPFPSWRASRAAAVDGSRRDGPRPAGPRRESVVAYAVFRIPGRAGAPHTRAGSGRGGYR